MSTISASTTTTTAFKVTSDTTGTLVLQTGSTPTTAVTIDTSGNFGIGTSSPTSKLTVSSTASTYAVDITSTNTSINNRALNVYNSAATGTTALTNHIVRLASNGSGADCTLQMTDSVANNGYIGMKSGALNFGANTTTTQMTLTTAGRLGIGTTSPSDVLGISGGGIRIEGWNADITFIQQQFSAGYFQRVAGDSTNRQLRLESNSSDGGTSGSIVFKTSSSGTLATTMTLDGLGILGVGITPNTWGGGGKAIQLPGGAISGYSSAGNNQLILWNNCYYGTNFTYTTTDYANYFRIYNGTYAWFNAPSGTAGTTPTFTQVMTLTNGGYLGIGTTAPNYPLVVSSGNAAGVEISPSGGINSGAFLQCYNRATSVYVPFTTYASEMYWSINGSEKMRLDSSGNLLVGTTTAGAKLCLQVGATGTGILERWAATGGTAAYFEVNSVNVGSITTSTTATAYNTSSDYRLKSDVQPMAGALARVAALKPVTYKWNIDGSAGEGFIAHELAEVCPYAVTGEKDAVDAEGKPVYQGVDTSFLVATLAAAIQELKAEFDAYKASHP